MLSQHAVTHVTFIFVPEMTYYVSSGTLNLTKTKAMTFILSRTIQDSKFCRTACDYYKILNHNQPS